MFADLENEVVGVLQANLSPGLVPAASVVVGPIAVPQAANFPTVAFAVTGFQVIPDDDQTPPPREVKSPNSDTFPAATGTTLNLSAPPPLEPLRAVVVTPPVGAPQILRERDDYSVDYIGGIVRLRLPPEGSVRVDYFTRRTLHIVSATRLRATGRLSVWASPTAANGMVQVSLTAVGALLSNAANLNGFLSRSENIADSGLASAGVRQAFLIFETPVLAQGQEASATEWDLDMTIPAWVVLVPRDEPAGIIRHVATSLSWDGSIARRVLSAPPKVLSRSVTDMVGVDASLAATLSGRGIASIGDLAVATPIGPAAADTAIANARSIRGFADRLVGEIVQAQPRINDLPGFLAEPLAAVDLSALQIAPAAASAITADAASLAALCTAPLTFADLLAN